MLSQCGDRVGDRLPSYAGSHREITPEPEALSGCSCSPFCSPHSGRCRSRPPEALPGHREGRSPRRLAALERARPRPSTWARRARRPRARAVVLWCLRETPTIPYDRTKAEAAPPADSMPLCSAGGRADAFTQEDGSDGAGLPVRRFLVPGLIGMNLMGTGMWAGASVVSHATEPASGSLRRPSGKPSAGANSRRGDRSIPKRSLLFLPVLRLGVQFARY